MSARFVAIALVGTLSALPATAKSKKDTICEELGDASKQFAQMRRDGSAETDAQLVFLEKNASSKLLEMQLVPVISSYVYGLSEDQLAGDVETPFVDQCKAMDG